MTFVSSVDAAARIRPGDRNEDALSEDNVAA